MAKKSNGWTALSETTKADILAIEKADVDWANGLTDRLLDQMRLLDDRDPNGAMPVSRLEHCLQCATRAVRDGRDEEYIACALLHDIGDVIAPHNHAAVAADILKPFVSERNHWMVLHHSIFQGYYFFHHLGQNRNARDAFEGHPYSQYTREFCELYDQNSFDPAYKSFSLEHFAPMLHRVFRKPTAADAEDGMTGAEIKSLLKSMPGASPIA